MSEKPDIEMSPEAIQLFMHMTADYMEAVDQLSPNGTSSMRTLVFVIPTDTAAPTDETNTQLSCMQMMTNIDESDVVRVLKRIVESIEKAQAAGNVKRSVILGGYTGELPN